MLSTSEELQHFDWTGGKGQVGSANFLEHISQRWQKATKTLSGFDLTQRTIGKVRTAETHPHKSSWSLLPSTEEHACVFIHTHYKIVLWNTQELHTLEWQHVY